MINSRYLKVTCHYKPLISQSKFSGPENLLGDISSLRKKQLGCKEKHEMSIIIFFEMRGYFEI